MDTLRKMQLKFLGYLLDDEAIDIVADIESTPRHSAQQRMLLYGSAYTLRLKEALSTDYERLHGYLGDNLFDDLMQHYIERYPSHDPSLRCFGENMADLLACLAPFKSLPEVAELARIEKAFGNSFDAADGLCITLEQLAQLKPVAWATLSLRFHDAVQLLPQQCNSFQIWQALANEQVPPEKTVDHTTWLIWRQDMVSRYRALQNAELAALVCVKSGGNFADLCEALLTHFSEQETPQRAAAYLQQWINDEMVCELNVFSA